MKEKLFTVLLFFMMCHLCGHGVEAQLSFQDLGETGAPVLPLPLNNDISDGPITVSGGGIPYLVTEMATDVYISDNGIISLNNEFVDPPQQGSDFSAADGEGVVIIAPYWSDNDIRLSGAVRYVEYTSTHPIPAVGAKLVEISEFFSNMAGTVFSGVWMLLVEWNNCPPFPAGSSGPIDPSIDATFLSSNNSYQAILITDSVSQSYAAFIYECNQIEWSGYNSTHSRVGISDGITGRSNVHPMSGNASIVDIDCSNSPTSTIVNVLLDLNTFALVEQVFPFASITLSSDSVSPSVPSQMQTPSVLDSISPNGIAVVSTPSQTTTPLASHLVSPGVITVVSTQSQTQTPSVSDSISPNGIAVVLTPSQTATPLASHLVSPSVIAVVSTPSQTLTPSVLDSISPDEIAVVSTPSQTATPLASHLVSPSVIAVVSTQSQTQTPSVSDSISANGIAVVLTPSQTATPSASHLVSPSVIAVVSTPSQTLTPSVLDSISPDEIAVVLTPSQTATLLASHLVSPSVIAVVSTPSQTLTLSVLDSISPNGIAVVSTPSQTLTPSVSDSISPNGIAVVSTPSQTLTPLSDSISPNGIAVGPSQTATPLASHLVSPTPLASHLVSPSVIAVVSTPSQTLTPSVLDSISPNGIAVVSTPSQTLTPSVSDSFSPNEIAVVLTPSQMLAQLTTSATTSMTMPQDTTNNFAAVNAIVMPIATVVLLLILVSCQVIIFLFLCIHHKKTVKVGPTGKANEVD